MKKSIMKILVAYPLILLLALLLFRHESIVNTDLLKAYLGYYVFSSLTIMLFITLNLTQVIRNYPNISFIRGTSTIISIVLLANILLLSNNIYNIYFWSCFGILLSINEALSSIRAFQKKA